MLSLTSLSPERDAVDSVLPVLLSLDATSEKESSSRRDGGFDATLSVAGGEPLPQS
jgi:hypothetical protein